MDNIKNDRYYLKKMTEDLNFVLLHMSGVTIEQLEDNPVLADSMMFRMIQISENSARLTDDFKRAHDDIPWHAIRGMRNRIVHEYGKVDLTIVYDSITRDFPVLYKKLIELL